jgi:hypothetical protein
MTRGWLFAIHRAAKRSTGLPGWRAFAVSVAAILLVALSPMAASADPFGTCDATDHVGCLADSAIHTYCFGAYFDDSLEDEAHYAMRTSLDDDTVMSDQFEGEGSGACDSTIDVKWRDRDLDIGVRGQYECLDLVAGRCVEATI